MARRIIPAAGDRPPHLVATKKDVPVSAEGAGLAPRRKGRRALPIEKKSVPGSVRLTPERWAKLRRLGSAWLAKAIDRAPDPGIR